MVGVRDLWLAISMHVIKDEKDEKDGERQLLQDVLEKLEDDSFITAEVQSIPFSLSPTRNRTVLRLMEHLEEVEREGEKEGESSFFEESAAQIKLPPSSSSGEPLLLYTVWVDARDLSFHNFESILPLDRALSAPGHPLSLSFKNVSQPNPEMKVFVADIAGKDTDLLIKLD